LQTTAPPGTPDVDSAILHGLRMLTGDLLSRTYSRMDGASMFIDCLGIDIGYKDYLVKQLLQISPHAARIQPMKGAGIGPENKPISEYRRSKGVVIGNHWWTPPIRGTTQIRHVHVDTNHWKSFVHRHLAIPLGGKGCVSLWGAAKDREQHRYWAEMIADSEYFERTEGRGRVVDVWNLHVAKPDNHAFDNVVGCAVLASKLGITESESVPRPARQKVKLSEVQKHKRQQRMGAR
jgi:phage terminase large subunit GpA-like protein